MFDVLSDFKSLNKFTNTDIDDLKMPNKRRRMNNSKSKKSKKKFHH